MPGFTPLYGWVMESEELTHSEGLVVCRVLKYKENGCYESSSNIGKALKMDIRTAQRNINALCEKGWLVRCRITKKYRYLFVHPSKLKAGPLYDYVKVGTEIIKRITAYNMAVTRRGKIRALTA